MGIYAAIVASLLIGFLMVYSICKGDRLLKFLDYFLLSIVAICISVICFISITGIVVAIDSCKHSKIPEEKFVQFEQKGYFILGFDHLSPQYNLDGDCIDRSVFKIVSVGIGPAAINEDTLIEPKSNKE